MSIKLLFITSLIPVCIFGQLLNNPNDKFNYFERTLFKMSEDSGSLLTEQIIQLWKGSEWESVNKTITKYNQINLIENEKCYSWNINNWEEYKRTFYFYNSDKKLDTVFTEEFFLDWDTTSFTSYKYDEEGRECERFIKIWRPDQDIVSQVKVIWVYKDGNISEAGNQKYENGLWLDSDRTIYQYNPHNKLTERLTQLFENNNWINFSRNNYTYDENDYQIKSVQLTWSNTAWDTLNMHIFTNDSFGQLIEENRKVKQNGIWINDSKFTYEYNNSGKVIFHKFQYWIDSILVNGNMNFYEYDENGNITLETEQGWKNDNWENQFKTNYVYDSKGNLIKKIYNNWSNGNWTNTVQYIYSYNDKTNINEKDFNVYNFELMNNYPNPFNPVTNIRYSIPITAKVRLSVYNLLGEEVAILVNNVRNKGTYEINFNANSLTSGVYFYRIDVGNKYSEVRKMMLIK